jgi:hypothetical protein
MPIPFYRNQEQNTNTILVAPKQPVQSKIVVNQQAKASQPKASQPKATNDEPMEIDFNYIISELPEKEKVEEFLQNYINKLENENNSDDEYMESSEYQTDK